MSGQRTNRIARKRPLQIRKSIAVGVADLIDPPEKRLLGRTSAILNDHNCPWSKLVPNDSKMPSSKAVFGIFTRAYCVESGDEMQCI